MDDKELIERLQKLATRVSVLGIDGTNFTLTAARLTALAEENERLRQLLWSSREMLECAEYKDAESGVGCMEGDLSE